ncbi:uncharacterized protein LOC143909826 [Arctopsyche grandis]|uniref:uncharacterized protein LOC143909826 n=1 Tax=Arctopsyche grandis TaxID=121162 RepID=UPI00406D71F7
MKLVAILIIAIACMCNAGKRKAQGKLRYELNWVGGLNSCEDFDNSYFDATQLKMEKVSPTSTALAGDLVLYKAVEDETEILIVIEKETPQGKVIAYTMEINNLCDHVKEEGMPWSIFFEAMNLDPLACPIPAATYKIDELKLAMAFLDSMLNQDTVGEYMAKVEFRRKGEGLDVVEHDVACYNVGFSVDEVRDQAE